MPPRASLGASEYELIADNAPLLKAFLEAEAQAKKSSQEIGQATTAASKALGSAGTSIGGIYSKIAASSQASAQKQIAASNAATAAFDKQLAAAKRAAGQGGGGVGLPSFGRAVQIGAVVAGASVLGGGVIASAQLLNEAITGTVETAIKADQAQKALNVTFGQSAGVFNKAAQELAAYSGRSVASLQAATVQTGTLARNYGLTADQISVLIKRSADLASVSGRDVADVTQRVTAALRGEGEAAEALGLTLNSDAVKGMANMTEAQRASFETMDQGTKALIIYNEFLRQSSFAQGAAANDSKTLSGAAAQLGASWENLGAALGKANEQEFVAIARGAKFLADEITKLLLGTSALQKKAAEINAKSGRGRVGIGGDLETDETRTTTEPYPDQSILNRRAQFPPGEERTAADVTTDQMIQKERELETVAKNSLKARIEAAKGAYELRKELLENEKKNVIDQAQNEREVIEDKRDKDIQASRDAAEEAINALTRRQQAAADYYSNEINQVQDRRDKDIQASQDRADAELAAIDREKRAIDDRRTTEDRAREDSRQSERRAIEANGEAFQASIDANVRGIERARDAQVRAYDEQKDKIEDVRDAALRSIDEQMDAEDRRHREAMQGLDDEEDARLGVIDAQLDAIDKAENKERRQETDRSLKRALADAKRELKEADTPQEKSRAKRNVSDAEADISKERRRRQREDQRESLRDQAKAIKVEIDQRRKAEDEQARIEKEALEASKQKITDEATTKLEAIDQKKQAVQDQATVEIEYLKSVADAYKANQEAELQALEDRYKEEDRIREDERKKEDQVLDDRKKAVQERAKNEQDQIRATADIEIESLRKRAREADRYYADQKRQVQDAAEDQQRAIREVADEHIRKLREQTEATILELDKMGKEWERLRDRIIKALEGALKNIKQYLAGTLVVEFRPAAGGGAGQAGIGGGGTGTGGSGQSPTGGGGGGPWYFSGRYDARGNLIYSNTRGDTKVVPPGVDPNGSGGSRGSSPIQARHTGGDIFAGQPYKVQKDEIIVPQQAGYVIPRAGIAGSPLLRNPGDLRRPGKAGDLQGGGGVTVQVTNNVDGRGVQNVDQLAQLIQSRTELSVARMLATVERLTADPKPRTQGRAQ